jgi:hypothetical protein
MTRPACPALPRGRHACGHRADIVALLRWARARGAPFAAADLSEDGRFALDSLVVNRYVAPADGGPIPQGWRTVAFVVSDAGHAVLSRADAAEPAAAKAA